MEEVEILCDRVMILDKGHVIASGTCDALKQLAHLEEKVSVEGIQVSEQLLEEIQNFKNVEEVLYHDSLLVISYKKGKNNLTELIEYFKNRKIEYSKIFSERPTLNDVFLELTGKELRD